MKKRFALLSVFLLMVFSLFACGSNESQPASSPEGKETTNNGGEDLPKSIMIATHPTGSSYHVIGSGIAKLLSDETQIRGMVQPSAGPNSYMAELNEGTVQFAILSSHDASWGKHGGPGYDKPSENVRMVLAGNRAFNIGLAARKDSGVTQLKDIKGKRVATDYGGNISQNQNLELVLESVGLTVEDVEAVPVPDIATGMKLLQDGTVDATMAGGPDGAPLLEVHSAVGAVGLPFGDLTPEDIKDGTPSEFQEMLDRKLPGVILGVAPKGLGILDEDMVLSQGLIVMASTTKASPDAVYTVLKAIYDNQTELAKVHPWLENWKPETMLIDNPPIPYHDGAVKFFKEIGKWTDEHQKAQDALLAK